MIKRFGLMPKFALCSFIDCSLQATPKPDGSGKFFVAVFRQAQHDNHKNFKRISGAEPDTRTTSAPFHKNLHDLSI